MPDTEFKQEPSGAFNSLYLDESDPSHKPPFYEGKEVLIDGKLEAWSGEVTEVFSPVFTRSGQPIRIGTCPSMGEGEALRAVRAAAAAYNHGLGYWPNCGAAARIKAVERFIVGLQAARDVIVELLMWEICKNREDAGKEVDRTITYIRDTIAELKKIENACSTYEVVQGVIGHIRRAPLGVVLCLGPFNYPLNETYTTFIPALIMGNTTVLKLPKTGCLAHLPTIALFASVFPPGVVNVISGAGRSTMPPVMRTGLVDVFAFMSGERRERDCLSRSKAAVADWLTPLPPVSALQRHEHGGQRDDQGPSVAQPAARLPRAGCQEPGLRVAVC